jgi:capsular exopolysaccharide synthesis family protein
VTLRSYLRVLRERWKLLVSFLLLAVAVAFVITRITPKEYEATAKVLVSPSGAASSLGNAQEGAFLNSQVTSFAQVISSINVLNHVKTDLNLNITAQALKGRLSTSVPTGQLIIDVHAKDGNADQAARLADSAATGLATAVEGFTNTTQGASVQLYVVEDATAPSKPTTPNTLLDLALGVVVGLLVGVALAVARDILDTRIKDADTLAKVAASPTMGVVVEDPKTGRHPIATRAGTRNMRAENYRQLRANLQFANVDEHPRVIAVTSSIPGEGKTTVAINLASTLAEAGFTVCLVDADLRRPTIAKVLGLLSPVGLTSVLIHQIELSEAMQSAGSNFYVLTSGPTPPNPSEVLASSYVRDIVRSLLDKVDYVVLDTAPLLPVADGSEVAALADGTLLVARHGVSTDSHIKRAVHALDRVDAKLLGVVLNRIPARKSSEYGYTYYRAENEVSAHANPTGRGSRRAK